MSRHLLIPQWGKALISYRRYPVEIVGLPRESEGFSGTGKGPLPIREKGGEGDRLLHFEPIAKSILSASTVKREPPCQKPGDHPNFRKNALGVKRPLSESELSESSGVFSEQLSELEIPFSEYEIPFSEWPLTT